MAKNLAKRLHDIEQAALTAAAKHLYAAICVNEERLGLGLLSRPKMEQDVWRKLSLEIITEYNSVKVKLLGEPD